jgi:hypothetical protein
VVVNSYEQHCAPGQCRTDPITSLASWARANGAADGDFTTAALPRCLPSPHCTATIQRGGGLSGRLTASSQSYEGYDAQPGETAYFVQVSVRHA